MGTPPGAPAFTVSAIDRFARDVRLRLPFRFGAVTLTAAPQAFVRATIRLADGREATGAAAELLVPKWFDKNPALGDEAHFEQRRGATRPGSRATRTWPVRPPPPSVTSRHSIRPTSSAARRAG